MNDIGPDKASPSSALLLFGHETEDDGRLSDIALTRCAVALGILRANPDMLVLTTGAFGVHFNRTRLGHGAALSAYLGSHGISRDRILVPANSTNTLEDALCARRSLVDRGITDLTVVTSGFHMPRVKFIVRRVFPDFSLTFVSARSPRERGRDRLKRVRHEKTAIADLSRNWIDIPPYKGGPVPKEIYENASIEHRHYDTVSLALVTGMFVVFVYPFAKQVSEVEPFVGAGRLAAIPIIVALAVMYWRSADCARLARNLLKNIELGYGAPGFSANYRRQAFAQTRYAFERAKTIRGLVLISSVLMVSASLFSVPIVGEIAMEAIHWVGGLLKRYLTWA